ncbi:hypothetical protein [Nocardia nova]|uniref:hypothetical protein n=1 Tax=Nocardia nova TaxID=37330 RepID=UPI0011B0D297|nr:hypothetical protein [Nocardia nova]
MTNGRRTCPFWATDQLSFEGSTVWLVRNHQTEFIDAVRARQEGGVVIPSVAPSAVAVVTVYVDDLAELILAVHDVATDIPRRLRHQYDNVIDIVAATVSDVRPEVAQRRYRLDQPPTAAFAVKQGRLGVASLSNTMTDSRARRSTLVRADPKSAGLHGWPNIPTTPCWRRTSLPR